MADPLELPKLLPARNPRRHCGRNDPCPCGSGRKYKRCCLDRDTKASLEESNRRQIAYANRAAFRDG